MTTERVNAEIREGRRMDPGSATEGLLPGNGAALQRSGGAGLEAIFHTEHSLALDIRQFGSRFEGGPLVFGYVDGREWIVPFDYSYRLADGRVSTVRAGFRVDFASVPRIFWRILPPAGLRGSPYGLAACWHDWIYAHQAIGGVAITRAQADQLMLEMMLYIGVEPIRAHVIYRAVRLGGWVAWNRVETRLKETT